MRQGAWIILAAAIALGVLVFHSLATVEPVEVVQSHLERLEGQVFVAGAVNNSGEHPQAIALEIHYYDKNGRPLGEDKLNLTGLPAGHMQRFQSPQRTLAGVAAFSIDLNHGRNPYGNLRAAD